MTKEEYLKMAAAHWEGLQKLEEETNFYDYEKKFDHLMVDFGQQLLNKQMVDTKTISQTPPFGNEGTFNGFKFHQPLTRRIDYIFVDRTQSNVLKYAALSDSKDCRYPSDHLPVFVEIMIKE